MNLNLSFSSLQLISSSSCFPNHICTPTPKSHLLCHPVIRKPYFRVFLSSTHSATPTTTRKPVTVYLTERLGFSEEQSLSISKRLRSLRDYRHVQHSTDLISYENADNIITFLQDENENECGLGLGLDLSQVKQIVSKYPAILSADVDKTIKPKVKLLQDLGFSTPDLARILSANPALYLKYDLTPAIQALRGILGSDEVVVNVFKAFKFGAANNIINNLIPNVTMLENEYGIPRDKMIKFLTKTPQALVRNTEWLRDVLFRMEDKWGITRDSKEFVRAIHVFGCLSDESINAKCQVFRSYGWSDSHILTMIRKYPTCFTSSEARFKKLLGFYMNGLGYDSAYLAARPALFNYSLENRVVPRYRVLSILKEKGRIKADFQLYTVLQFSESKFLDKFIIPFKDVVPNLCEVYANRGESIDVFLHKETSKDESKRKVATNNNNNSVNPISDDGVLRRSDVHSLTPKVERLFKLQFKKRRKKLLLNDRHSL